MDVLRQEYVDAYAKIKSNDKQLLAVGIIRKIEEDILEIQPKTNRRLATLPYGLPVKIYINQKGCENLSLAGVVYLSNDVSLVVNALKPLEEMENRNFFRVDIDVEGVLCDIQNLLHQETRQINENNQKMIRVVDVSIRGVKLIADHWLGLGKDYLLCFQLHETKFSLRIKIVRIIALLDMPIEYGCLFIDVQEKEEAALCKCLYQIEVIKRQQKVHLVER